MSNNNGNSENEHVNGASIQLNENDQLSESEPVILAEAVIELDSVQAEETPSPIDTNSITPSEIDPIKKEFPTSPVVTNLRNSGLYINRELSQIAFNKRVLMQAFDERVPILERVHFLSIVSSNMDEFFMVRVSGLRQQVMLGITRPSVDGLTPRQQLNAIHKDVSKLQKLEMQCWHEHILPELQDNRIHFVDYEDLKKKPKRKIEEYFKQEIFPILTPLSFDPSHPFPHISNLSVNLAVIIRDPETDLRRFARVKVPNSIPRLVPLKSLDPHDYVDRRTHKFVWIEQVIKHNLDLLFPGMEIIDAHPFRITRNTDMEIQEEEADDLLMTMEKSLQQRHFGFPVRLVVEDNMPDDMLDVLISNLQINEHDVYPIRGPLALSSLRELHSLELPLLKYPVHQPVVHPHFQMGEPIFSVLKQKDVLLHHPYDSFSSVIEFLEEAANDPDVLAIKQTLYRVGNNSPIVKALMKARENGKQVAALVELKARFDEATNIEWARAMERVGVHVVYGVLGLKTHSKMSMVVRKERDGIRRYVHISTGNYNSTTARFYTDVSIMTSDPLISSDAGDVFNFLTGFSRQKEFASLLVAPMTLRSQLLTHIHNETSLGEEGQIIIKANHLTDPVMIQALYEASQAGVQIELIIRGLCGLRPGIQGVSETIRVVSIIGRFLEHSRIYYFKNQDDPKLFLGSADLMPRNLDRRVEVLIPVNDEKIRDHIVNEILQVQLNDTAKGWKLKSSGSYKRIRDESDGDDELLDSQDWHIQQALDRAIKLMHQEPQQ